MIRILLSITIWLRKYQGRGGNYYTIYNAAGLLTGLLLSYLLLAREFIYNNFICQIDKGLVGGVIILLSISFSSGLIYLLMYKLKMKKVYLHYNAYKYNLIFVAFMSLVLLIILLTK